MTFTSLAFPVFLLTIVTLRHWVRRVSTHTWLLLVASYVFYLLSSLYGVLLVTAVAVVDFNIGRRLASVQDPDRRRRWLWVSLATNLGVLVFFKYTNFLLESIGSGLAAFGVQVHSPHFDIALPIGISYFTFTGISYIVDVYYERIEPCRNLQGYLLYITYFPKLLAGPLTRAADLIPQLQARVRASAADIETGVLLFLLGAIKKVVIADQLAGHVGMIFASPNQYDAVTLLEGMVGYTVQIYCDFSGYSDMAIGCARIMGVRLPENFLMPYSAVNITEFWRRWHITLSNWFRDYVFIPLEIAARGVPNPAARMSFSLLTTMVLCGLWHGAGWNFVIWGFVHGMSLAVHRIWRSRYPLRTQDYPLRRLRTVFSRLLTLGVIMVGWVFFRAESWSLALEYLNGLISWQDGLRLGSPYILPLTVLVFVAHVLFNKDRNWTEELPGWSIPVRVATYSTLLLWLSLMAVADSTPFVYVQF